MRRRINGRGIRAVYERFDRTHPQLNLPKNPVKAIDFYKPDPRRDVVTWKDLPDWWKAVENLSPIRRDCWKCCCSPACAGQRLLTT